MMINNVRLSGLGEGSLRSLKTLQFITIWKAELQLYETKYK